MIRRDKHNFIIQHNANYPDYLDGGDTASRTGLMAMCGSMPDLANLQRLVVLTGVSTYRIIRHPFQNSNGHPADSKDFRDWTDWRETSRDQVIAYCAGTKHGQITGPMHSAISRYAKSWFINKDFLLPHYKLTLNRAIFRRGSLVLRLFGYPFLMLHILFSAYLKPSAEQNQTIAMLAHYPDWMLRFFCKAHGDIAENMFTYWAGHLWRDQWEIGFAICEYIDHRTGLDLSNQYDQWSKYR